MSDSPPALASSPASPVADSSEWMHVGPEMGEAEYVVALQKLGIQMAASIPQKLQERADTQTKMKNTVGKVQKLWMWQNSPDASRSPWVQKIKDFMEKAHDDPTPVGKGAEPDSDVSSNIWGDQQLQLVLADDIGLEGASKEPAASCDQGADGAGHEGESHEPGSKHIEAANALFTDEDPEAFKDALNEIKPEPVDVEPAHGSKSKKRKRVGEARVEVLLRQQALKPKSDVQGNKLSGEKGKSMTFAKNIKDTWDQVRKKMGMADPEEVD
ncbi:unnamed protein product [Cladocopium goreaui]|uniref:Uncharacterized protein n=1 Tax=Cladocopium goreaui TaxID=2562237 RepID=A0A9P1D068_9DINO|nr:unnamed protein product [Cladocopium goreaui]